MALRDKARTKHVAAAARLLPAGTQIRGYAVGQAQARWANGAIVAIGLFLTVFVVGLALGVIFYPGGLLLYYVYNSVRPQRGVAATDHGLVLLERSLLNGRPRRVLANEGFMVLASPHTVGSKTMVRVGPDDVTFPRAEYDRLVGAATWRPAGLRVI